MTYRTVCILTAYQKTDFQKELLNTCVNSIREHMNTIDIVVLNDNSANPIHILDTENVKIENTKFPRCGEVNAYVWACEHINEYDRFIFLHDSTVMLKAIPLELPNHFRPFWYTSKYVSDNMKGKEVESFINAFTVKGELCTDIYKNLLQNRGSIVFGGMAIFDDIFVRFLANETNFLDLAHTLNTRFLRCFFERLLFIVYSKFGNASIFNASAVCGDIFNHKGAFHPGKSIHKELANNPYVLKVWQGR